MRVEMPGIEPGAFHMQSERSTTEPHPHVTKNVGRGRDFFTVFPSSGVMYTLFYSTRKPALQLPVFFSRSSPRLALVTQAKGRQRGSKLYMGKLKPSCYNLLK